MSWIWRRDSHFGQVCITTLQEFYMVCQYYIDNIPSADPYWKDDLFHFIDPLDFITLKIRSKNCYHAHKIPNTNGPTRVGVSLFIAEIDSISEQTMGKGQSLTVKLRHSIVKTQTWWPLKRLQRWSFSTNVLAWSSVDIQQWRQRYFDTFARFDWRYLDAGYFLHQR